MWSEKLEWKSCEAMESLRGVVANLEGTSPTSGLEKFCGPGIESREENERISRLTERERVMH